jgi:hypothetical protein
MPARNGSKQGETTPPNQAEKLDQNHRNTLLFKVLEKVSINAHPREIYLIARHG